MKKVFTYKRMSKEQLELLQRLLEFLHNNNLTECKARSLRAKEAWRRKKAQNV